VRAERTDTLADTPGSEHPIACIVYVRPETFEERQHCARFEFTHAMDALHALVMQVQLEGERIQRAHASLLVAWARRVERAVGLFPDGSG
jgi:hypothetical protein